MLRLLLYCVPLLSIPILSSAVFRICCGCLLFIVVFILHVALCCQLAVCLFASKCPRFLFCFPGCTSVFVNLAARVAVNLFVLIYFVGVCSALCDLLSVCVFFVSSSIILCER